MAGSKNRNIPTKTYRALLARSGNKCAFPGCTHPLINIKEEYIAQLCHIESVAHDKQRYNPNLDESDLNGYDNLMFMCLKHHVETNDEVIFPVHAMREMKYEHESKYVVNPYLFDISHVYMLKKEAEEYWEKVDMLKNSSPALTAINSRAEYSELNEDVLNTLDFIQHQIIGIDDTLKQTNLNLFNIELPRGLSKVKALAEHMLIKYLETYVATNPQDMASKAKLESLRNHLLSTTNNPPV